MGSLVTKRQTISWIMRFFSCFINNCVTATYSSLNASNILPSGQNLPCSSFVIPPAYWWTGNMDIFGSMKSRYYIKHWIDKRHQENKCMNILLTTVWNSSVFRMTAWIFQPGLTSRHCSQEHCWNLQIPGVTKYPGVRALCNLICQQKELSALQCNGKAYALFCSAEADVENLDLFAKSHVGNMWQEKLWSKSWFKAKLSCEEFSCFS